MKTNILISAPVLTIMIVLFLNFILKTTDPRFPYLIISSVIIGLVYFLYGIFISFFSSKEECDKTSSVRATYHGISTAIVMIIIYITIYKVEFFNHVFKKIFTNKKLANSVAESTYMILSLLGITFINSQNSAKKVCDLTPKEISDNLEKYNAYLNTTPPTREDELDIEVR